MSTTTPHETFLDRIGIPHSLRWGFLGVLVFMTGNGTESNFISPHIEAVLGSPEATVATIITGYSLAVLVASYLSGALADLWGPRRVMTLGVAVWVVFEVLFLLSLQIGSLPLVAATYFLRGFGYPLFAFAFLVWINVVTPYSRNGVAVGWFYVMFTGGLPTLGSLFALGMIPAFGGSTGGETAAMVGSTALVVAGYLIARFGVHEPHATQRLAPAGETTGQVLTAGLRLTAANPKILMGFLVRLINTAPQYGMFIILPTVIAVDLGWGQSRWLTMTVFVYATNILVNAVFGAVGDRWGWRRTVQWFGVFGSAVGLLLWWYVPQLVPAGSTWGFWVSVAAGCVFGCLLAGFVPMGAIMPALAPDHQGAAMAMYTTAAGGAAFLGSGVVALMLALGTGNVGVVWAFVALYAAAFVMVSFLNVPQDAPEPRAAVATPVKETS
ncbi:alpha-ketoglutarate permease [Pseudonocardia sp. Ae406_Ps2]|uniref:RbtT/DalT/CsbX family MFS transporter n=1 Tax=unclassified Pseudonocardia TaxID=2619320 RepID=UPI00094B3C32|nr:MULTISPECIES: RbtT/DalT/CsbX family MFS transporter [unclassified Pseudonocardia]OLL98936.1 alpha-ketoglutarate permease [Pseudonocardia sp. Ae331_Ps2]OLM03321.1 alpha-ketoglutarate permease [Pseudonocardia sp. Ae406_Ps2]OLM11783.1 alpha-ketoglutarate permease [Pseudonocardia sp. Ae505_Ps2]OLM24886.1 alpha-ketoglutarate permease [Pseudonocardia sp. Ae706_Ps2]